MEEPAYLTAAEPTADDMAMFEQMMGAVLEAPTSVTQPSAEPTIDRQAAETQPGVEEPIAEEPEAELPAVEELEVEEPVAEEPEVAEPAVEEPAAELPAVEEPEAELPVVEVLPVEEPVVEEPEAELPAVEELEVEEPVAEEPEVAEPAVEEPAAELPAAEEPEVAEPTSEEIREALYVEEVVEPVELLETLRYDEPPLDLLEALPPESYTTEAEYGIGSGEAPVPVDTLLTPADAELSGLSDVPVSGGSDEVAAEEALPISDLLAALETPQPVEAAPEPDAAQPPARTGDFAADLMALGLGELPTDEELLAVEEASELEESAPSETMDALEAGELAESALLPRERRDGRSGVSGGAADTGPRSGCGCRHRHRLVRGGSGFRRHLDRCVPGGLRLRRRVLCPRAWRRAHGADGGRSHAHAAAGNGREARRGR